MSTQKMPSNEVISMTNEVTGNPVKRLHGVLQRIGTTSIPNSNGKNYRIADVTVVIKDTVKTASVIAYEKLVFTEEGEPRIKEGDNCFVDCEIIQGSNKPLTTLSLSGGERITFDDLGLEFEEEQKVAATALKSKVTIK